MPIPFVLNREVILERLGGDEDIFLMMVDMYLQDFDNNVKALGEAWAQGNADTLMREAHTVKGLLATLSDEVGAAEAGAVEKFAKQGEIADLQPAVAAIQQRLLEVANVLRAEVDNVG